LPSHACPCPVPQTCLQSPSTHSYPASQSESKLHPGEEGHTHVLELHTGSVVVTAQLFDATAHSCGLPSAHKNLVWSDEHT